MNKKELSRMENIMLTYLVANHIKHPVGFVHISYVGDEPDIEPLTAYTTHLGKCPLTTLSAFEISYHPQLRDNLPLFTKMIAHELVHVMQTLRGDSFDYTLPYLEQPHEIEAYALEEEVANYYENNKAPL